MIWTCISFFNDDSLTTCENCGYSSLNRIRSSSFPTTESLQLCSLCGRSECRADLRSNELTEPLDSLIRTPSCINQDTPSRLAIVCITRPIIYLLEQRITKRTEIDVERVAILGIRIEHRLQHITKLICK